MISLNIVLTSTLLQIQHVCSTSASIKIKSALTLKRKAGFRLAVESEVTVLLIRRSGVRENVELVRISHRKNAWGISVVRKFARQIHKKFLVAKSTYCLMDLEKRFNSQWVKFVSVLNGALV